MSTDSCTCACTHVFSAHPSTDGKGFHFLLILQQRAAVVGENVQVKGVVGASTGPFLTYGSFHLHFFLPPPRPFLNSVHITEHFTLLNPPPPLPRMTEPGTQVICHQKGVYVWGGGGGGLQKELAQHESPKLGMTEAVKSDVDANRSNGDTCS